jgi:ElaB/YqjD/DUF883 family membrane-anchored ribosome-binding protein
MSVDADKLAADLVTLEAHMEQLLSTAAGQARRRVARVSAKAGQSLSLARARLADMQDAAQARARAAGRATDDYVRANPWRSMALAATVGLVLGVLLMRGGDDSSM